MEAIDAGSIEMTRLLLVRGAVVASAAAADEVQYIHSFMSQIALNLLSDHLAPVEITYMRLR
jgi:hypothetical protein